MGCSSRILTFYPSRIRGLKRYRIPDPQHLCLQKSSKQLHSTFSFTSTILLAFLSIQRFIVTLFVGELQVSPHTLHPPLLQLAVQLLEQRLTSQIPTGT